jgi:hypothetical protein
LVVEWQGVSYFIINRLLEHATNQLLLNLI